MGGGYCIVPGCEREEESAGYCAGHRKRRSEGRALWPALSETDLSPYERIIEAIKVIDAPEYDGPAGEHAWRMRVRAACWDWLDPGGELRRIARVRRQRLAGSRRRSAGAGG